MEALFPNDSEYTDVYLRVLSITLGALVGAREASVIGGMKYELALLLFRGEGGT